MICDQRIFLILFLFFFLGSYLLSAQPSSILNKDVVFDQLPNELGLSEPGINCILQDQDGYLWIGTWSGLIRYDGYSTKTYYSNKKSPYSLRSNKIISLLQDSKGNLWVGTHKGGLFRFNPVTEKFYQFKNNPKNKGSLSNDNVWALMEDKAGNIWVGTEYGLNILDTETGNFVKYFSHPSDLQSLSDNFITDIHQSSSGKVWISTEDGFNLAEKNKEGIRFKRYYYEKDPENRELHNYFYQLGGYVKDGKEILWISSKKGLKKFSDEKMISYELENKASAYNFFRALYIVEGKDNLVFVGSEMGLNIFQPEEEKFISLYENNPEQASLTHGTITSLYLDQSKVLWVGTKKGINKYDTYSKNFNLFKTRTFDPTESIITGIRESKPGEYWICTMGGGIFKFRPKINTTYNYSSLYQRYQINTQRENDFVDFVQHLFIDSRNNVWVGTAGDGVYSFNEKNNSGTSIDNFEHYSKKTDQAISDDYIMSITEDQDNSIWLGTWSGGLSRILPEGKVINYKESQLAQAPIIVLHQSSEGDLWVGSRGNGLYKIKAGDQQYLRLEKYDLEEGLENLFVNAIYEDEHKNLWIGTEDGIYKYNQELNNFNRHEIINESGKEVIVGILGDQKGRLWLSHWEGLTVIDPNNPAAPVRNFDRQDRIQGGFYYNNSSITDSRGFLIFGGPNGYNVIDPKSDLLNPVPPKVAINELQIHNKPVQVGEEFNGRILFQKEWNKNDDVRLQHDENSLSFEFTALHFAAPEKIHYAYKLEGFDEDWHHTESDRRFANYTNLPAGDYRFLVKATNNDGIWGETVSEMSFAVMPPWWKTNWAIAGYLMVFIFILFVFRRIIIIRTNFINDLKLERLERANVEDVNKAKLEFFTNISHEFRTPLTLILGPLQKIMDLGLGDKNVRQQLRIIDNNAQRLLRLINQLLDFRKAESGNFTLEVAEGNIVKFIQEVKLSFEGVAAQKKINFNLTTSKENIPLWFDRDQFEKILYNLLSNAFKYTPKEGTVNIEVFEREGFVQLSVKNTGSSIQIDQLDNIFKRFYSGHDLVNPSGIGIGLALTKSLVELHGGRIEVNNIDEDTTTSFNIFIPQGKAHFKSGELQHNFMDSEQIMKYEPREREIMPSEEELGDSDAPKILVVEDNEEVRAYIKSIFIGKFNVLEAVHGEEGLHIAQEEMPEAIISDVMMPVMNGIKMCKELKNDIKTSHIPIILLTARTPLIFRVEGLEMGADDYITKPFEPKALELKVRNLIKLRETIRKAFNDNKVLSIEPGQVTLTSADELFIGKLLSSVEKNMDNSDYSVEHLAEDACLSRMQLYRKIKSLTGQSANEFIRTIRLKRAAQLLEQNQLTIAEVTYQVGFTDLKYFRSCFKKQFGVNPSSYAASGKQAEVDVR